MYVRTCNHSSFQRMFTSLTIITLLAGYMGTALTSRCNALMVIPQAGGTSIKGHVFSQCTTDAAPLVVDYSTNAPVDITLYCSIQDGHLYDFLNLVEGDVLEDGSVIDADGYQLPISVL